jgi:carboxylate-amine ligase
MLYLDTRIAKAYPTIEVRVADVCTEVEDAVLIASLARALVETAANESDSRPGAATCSAASGGRPHGLADAREPATGLAPARQVFEALPHPRRAGPARRGRLGLTGDASTG